MVANLIDPTHHNWNTSVIQNFFDEHIATEILTIPIRPLYSEDKLVWSAMTDGKHTVKSNYHAIVHSSNNQQSHSASASYRNSKSL